MKVFYPKLSANFSVGLVLITAINAKKAAEQLNEHLVLNGSAPTACADDFHQLCTYAPAVRVLHPGR